jgi:CheY-like chemotaxis protein
MQLRIVSIFHFPFEELVMKTILVVEDNSQHLRAAVVALESAGVTVVTAVDASEGMKKMRREKEGSKHWRPEYEAAVDGVITDIYMPYVDSPAYRHDKDPCGVLVASEAKRLGIPVIFCTSGYHHGDRYQWIFELGKVIDVSMVDSGQSSSRDPEERPSKDWKKALEWLFRKED